MWQRSGVFDRYEAALQANVISVLKELFWNDPTTTRYGVGENLYGWDEISAFRRSGRLGRFGRELSRTVMTTYGRDFATANTEYRCGGEALLGRETKTPRFGGARGAPGIGTSARSNPCAAQASHLRPSGSARLPRV